MANDINKQARFTFFVHIALVVVLTVGPAVAFARNDCPRQRAPMSATEYLGHYLSEAQRQRDKYGIPVSITLAQGMLESGYGSSYLAVVANNHFGIKAYSRGWKGAVVHCDDDRSNEPFCKFHSVEEGFEYHSTFLTGSPRYASLFRLDVTDYEGWAEGLQRCGYATSRHYASALIDLIERHHLDVYDQPTLRLTQHKLYTTARRHGLKYVIAQPGDELSSIAKEYDTTRRKLRRWNDLPRRYTLQSGDIVYLQAKHRRAAKGHDIHIVQRGESLLSIAQRYGVRVSSLVKRNKLTTAQVSEGQTLRLR